MTTAHGTDDTAVHQEITRLLARIDRTSGGPSALMEACVACLEAARSVSAAAVEPEERPGTGAREALHAVNAAVLAIRFALVKAGDEQRRTARDRNAASPDT